MADRTVSVRLQAQISDYMAKFSAAGKATTDFANKVDTAKGRAAQGYTSIGRGAMVAGGLVIAGFALAEQQMASFENKMQLVATLSHASAADMQQLHTAALTVGQAYGFTASQVADAEAELVKAGVSVSDIMGGALTGALTLAAAGQTDVASATTIAATAMTQFGLTGKDVPHIADLLASGADKALGSVTDLGYALDQAGPQAHQFHVSIEETVGTLAAFAQAGQIGERGGTVFSQMLIKLAAPGKEAATTLRQLGITLYNSQGQFVGIANLAGQLQTKMSKLSEEERNHALAVVFGARAIRGANILYQDGAKGIQDWTNKVNDSGFAALQASGKMNSLTGDVTKFRSALQVALIGAGEGANGPLRSLVQDATSVVKVWTGLPGPVRTGAEALLLAGGMAAFAGGAALIAVPKWAAMNAAIVASGRSAITARGALLGIGTLTATAGVLVGIGEAASALDKALLPAPPSVDRLTSSLLDLGATGRAQGELVKAFGPDLKTFTSELHKVADPTAGDKFRGSFLVTHNPFQALSDWVHGAHNDIEEARNDFKGLDAALAGLVTSGHADAAAKGYSELVTRAKAAGISTTDLAKAFPQYADALDASAASAQAAGDSIDKFGNKVGAAADATDKATQAAKDYNDTLHAMADPVFGLAKALKDVKTAQDAAHDAAAGGKSKDALTAQKALVAAEADYKKVTHEKKPNADTVAAALSRVRDAQSAYTAAVKAHLPGSSAAKQANLDLASAALDVTGAATTLSGALKDGATSTEQMSEQLQTWQHEGLLTKKQADEVANALGIVIGKAKALDGLNPHLTVTADTADAEAKLKLLSRTLTLLPGGGAAFHTVTAGGARTTRASLGDIAPRYQASAPTTTALPTGGGTRTTNVRQVFNIARVDEAPGSKVVLQNMANRVRLAALS